MKVRVAIKWKFRNFEALPSHKLVIWKVMQSVMALEFMVHETMVIVKEKELEKSCEGLCKAVLPDKKMKELSNGNCAVHPEPIALAIP